MGGNTDLGALPRLVRLIHKGRYDVVHTHLFRACVYGRVAARLAGVPVVVATEHSLGDERIEGRPLSAATRRLYLATERLGAATIAVSPTVAGRLRRWGVPGGRIRVVGNGIDLAGYAFDPLRRDRARAAMGLSDRFVVGLVGRLVPGKRVDRALHALAGRPGVVALVVGEGPLRTELVDLAATLGVPAVFTGESSDVPALLSAMDLLIAPSAGETFGLAVVEALAAGLPVLYAACPAVDDLPAALHPAGARRLAADLSDLDEAVSATLAAGPVRLAPPALLSHYDIAEVADRVDRLYADLRGLLPANHKGAARG
jgi:glycosyltransferase involved in cell wall biosynthesis